MELFDIRESKDVYLKLVDISSNLLKLEICTIDCYTLIDNYTNELLQNLFPNEEHYHKKVANCVWTYKENENLVNQGLSSFIFVSVCKEIVGNFYQNLLIMPSAHFYTQRRCLELLILPRQVFLMKNYSLIVGN